MYIVVDAQGHKLASFAEVTEAMRVSRTLNGAVAVLNAEGTVLARSELTDGVAEVRRLRPNTGKHHQQMTGGTTPPWIDEESATLRSVEQAIWLTDSRATVLRGRCST